MTINFYLWFNLNNMLTQQDLDKIEQKLKDFATKDDLKDFATKDDLLKHRSDLMNKLDKILKEILASREAQKIIGPRVSDHEQRITSLEKIHPQGKHATL